MKLNKWLFAISGIVLLTSCADEFDTNSYVVTRPGDAAQYDYLKAYEPLKNYVNRQAHPNFKVSAALTASEFNNKGNLYSVAVQNFDEIVAGNAFKQASVVADDGTMDLGTVSAFANNATDAGISVFGHTLLWHQQQATGWLNSLLTKTTKEGVTVVESEGPAGWEVWGPQSLQLVSRDADGAGDRVDDFQTIDGKQVVTVKSHDNPANSWDAQFFIGTPDKEWAGGEKYKITFWYKADAEADCESQCHGASAGAYKHWAMLPSNPHFTTEWQKYEAEATIPDAGDGMQYIAFNLNVLKTANTYYFADIVWEGNSLQTERTMNLPNPKMEEGKSMDAFVVREYGNADRPGDILVGQGPNGMNCTKVVAGDLVEQEWDTQFFIYNADHEFGGGDEVTVSMWIKADRDATADTQTQCHGTPGGYKHWACLPNFPRFTAEWQYYEQTFNIPDSGDGMQSIAFNLNADHSANTYYFADINWTYTEKAAPGATGYYYQNVIKNGHMTRRDLSCFAVGGGSASKVPAYAAGPDGANCIEVTSIAGASAGWETQFFITSDHVWSSGDKYQLSFDIQASEDVASLGFQCHGTPGAYMHWTINAANGLSASTEWKHYETSGTIPSEAAGMQTIAIILNDITDHAITYRFANVQWGVYQDVEDLKAMARPLSEEEKVENIEFAMTSWINAIVKETAGKVKAWDLLNEPILDDASGLRQSGDGFYYNQYLGDIDYLVMAEQAARAAYAAGDSASAANGELKLFVNEYGLEGAGNSKLDKLIEWVNTWEQNGAKIDGIGSQMHISMYADAAEQEKLKASIVSMLEKMVATKKLVRISELDMAISADGKFGVYNPNEKIVKSSEVTFEQLKQMSDFYQWIIEQYLTIVPAEQQYGICQWCMTDSAADSGWRPGEPTGLWFENFTSRKPAYAGWAEGLKK